MCTDDTLEPLQDGRGYRGHAGQRSRKSSYSPLSIRSQEEKEVEEYRKAVVAEARRRLLEEHSKRLAGFLPKGTIQSQGELTMMRGAM